MIKAVLFDLDGVIVSTDRCHYRAWKRMADEEGIFFDEKINDRLRGVSRMASLDIVLERARQTYSDAEKAEMAERKNNYYKELIRLLTPADILPGAMDNLRNLKEHGIRIAVGSSSKNTPIILKQIGLDTYFDAVSDGNNITRSRYGGQFRQRVLRERDHPLRRDCLRIRRQDPDDAERRER